MKNPKHVLSCDWGTSSFRLRLIDVDEVRCLAEVTSGNGNAVLFNKWKDQPSANRIHFYAQYLEGSIISLGDKTNILLNHLPILVSGMASSSIGMKELPYADIPFSLDGHSAYSEWINTEPLVSNPILLISGVQQPGDVMRGEETQLIGLTTLLDLPDDNEVLYLFPGTHCKHITVSNNRITHFSTFMTGEVFDLLIKHSILSHAVSFSDNNLIADEESGSFRAGVLKAFESELLSNLFSVRINQLKKHLSNQQNYFYLSGLLIGSEIKSLRNNRNRKFVICSSGALLRLYHSALICAGLSDQTIVVTSGILDNSAAAGQLKIFMNMASKLN